MTTEQKAEKYAMTYSRGLQKTAFRAFGEGYSEGMADQKKIDIDKAIEWVKYGNENGGCLFDGWEKSLRKAMEDEK